MNVDVNKGLHYGFAEDETGIPEGKFNEVRVMDGETELGSVVIAANGRIGVVANYINPVEVLPGRKYNERVSVLLVGLVPDLPGLLKPEDRAFIAQAGAVELFSWAQMGSNPNTLVTAAQNAVLEATAEGARIK